MIEVLSHDRQAGPPDHDSPKRAAVHDKSANHPWRRLGVLAVLIGALSSPAPAASTQNPVPAEAGEHFSKARAAEARADWAEAEQEYRKAIELAPTWAEAIVNLGVVYNRQGKTEEAVRAFTRAADLNPQLFGAHLNLAITYFRAKRFSEAEASLRRALGIEPENKQAAQLLAFTRFAQDRYTEVTALTEKLLVATPEDAALLEIAGRAYLKLRQYQEAVRVLEKRARLQPVSAEVYLLLGQARDHLHDAEGAIKEIRRAIVASTQAPLPDAHFALGYVLWKLRRYDEAETEFRKELERDAGHIPAIYYLGNIALARGDWAQALPRLERAAAAMPDDFAVQYDLGKALLESGRVERAVERLQAAIRINPKNAGAHYQLALALRRLNREDEAQREFAVARELNDAERKNLEQKVQGEEQKKKRP
jgi:Flp pilus assembly protein TadD